MDQAYSVPIPRVEDLLAIKLANRRGRWRASPGPTTRSCLGVVLVGVSRIVCKSRAKPATVTRRPRSIGQGRFQCLGIAE
jgi:hypothetical protein